jgi:hypothetical protein
MVTSLIKTRLSVQLDVEVGAASRIVVGVVFDCSRVEVGDESGTGNGVGENPPLQPDTNTTTQTMLMK